MDESRVFYPPKQIGTAVQIILIGIFSLGGAWGIWGIGRVEVALELLPYLGLILVFLIAVPFLIYRLYALHRSEYLLERDGIQLQWGWRSESIPMEDIKWVHRVDDLEIPPQLPVIHWPGAILGRRRFQRGPEVEFLASERRNLVVISSSEGYFAISPDRVGDFLSSYQQLTELGSISPLRVQSIRPSLIWSEVAENRPLLAIFGAGLLLNISLLIWVLLVIPRRDIIPMGFNPAGFPRESLDSVRLILFPIINTTAYLGNLTMGLFLYRNRENRWLAYILWGGSLLIGLIFHIGMIFILQ
jgi:hypothetical protein